MAIGQDQMTQQNPLKQGKQPPFQEPQQQPPGYEHQMNERPDYGLETYRGSGRLAGKAAIVTGGDSGIGRAIVLAFAREGADVLFAYLNEEEDAQETTRITQDSGHTARAVRGDVQDERHCRDLVDRAMQEFGHLDIVVNNAAFQMTRKSIEEVPPEEWEYTFRTNIFSMFYLCRAALPKMQPGSAIVNTASIEAYHPSPMLLAYSATKGAIVTFTKSLALEAVKRGVRVNAVAPGPVWTPLIPSTMPAEHVKEFGKNTPMGRPAQPVELAPAYVFLASQESSYITGEVIGVTGGRILS
jgi:NAD(P)-dependent dehydrogenase (short-subunit alcohol dehydrogenase family)